MWQLYQFPLCPFSRKVRLMLTEKGVAHELKRVSPWLQDDDFADLNPAAETPVLVEEQKGTVLIDSGAMCEYFEETIDRAPMIPGTSINRAEIRRLVAWFDGKLHHDVVGPMMEERMRKRLVSRSPPDTGALRKAMTAANGHLDYIDYLLDHRRWLAGPALTLADLAAAAQLSVADYLGGIDWRGHKQTADWYAVMKSRPSFRPLLSERMEVILPPTHYDKVDFDLDTRRSPAHIPLMLIQTETTPNPAALKFMPGQNVMDHGVRDFATPEEAEASPLAEAIFSTGEVEGVFFGRDFISVTAAPGVEWRQLKPQVLEVLLDHFASGAPLFRPGSAAGIAVAAEPAFEEDPADAEVITQIRELIETRVRPAVAQDGGDIVYRGFKEGIVYLAMHGACSGCPSSTATLKQGIESLLKHYVPEVESVEAI